MSFSWNLDMRLLQLGPNSFHTLRDGCAHVHCFGATSSGKTSGTGAALASAYLRAGMGGVVCTAKYTDVGLWLNYAKNSGRARSVVLFGEGAGFNFISYELSRQGMRGISNVVECLMHVLEAADTAMGAGGGKDKDPFWSQSSRQILQYALPLLYLALGPNITVGAIIDFVVSAATGDGKKYLEPQFAARSFAAKILQKAANSPVVRLPDAELRTLMEYWIVQYPAIPEKTRGNIVISLSAKLDRFRHGRMRDCFCANTTIVPEMAFQGAIIILAMPVLTWNEDGIIAQQLFKFMFQRAVDSRNGLHPSQRERPVFLWCDEAQYFTSASDEPFLSTCRASKCCVVYMTQTLPTYYARLGSDKTDVADGIVGKFATQVFHANACNRTNKFASELVGKGIQERANRSRSEGWNTNRGMSDGGGTNEGKSETGIFFNRNVSTNKGSAENFNVNVGKGRNASESWGTSEQVDYLLEPNFFAGSALLTGGPANRGLVSGVWFKAGARYPDAFVGGNTLLVTFKQ